MLLLGYGVTCGWASPSIILLTSDETPLPSGKISMDEASWIASLICVGGLIGNIMFGFITSKFGRKIPLIFITIPTIVSGFHFSINLKLILKLDYFYQFGWLLVLFAQNIYYLYAARLLNGFVGGGFYTIVPQFLSEIAVDR